jgi:hypothetical protein
LSINFTPEEREARLQQIAPLWAAGMSMLEIGLEIGIAGKNVADTIKRARKRGDTRFPPRERNRPPLKTARYPLTPDELAGEKAKRTPMAVIARRLRVPPGRIKRMYYALRKAGDPRFQDDWPLTPGYGAAPPSATVRPVEGTVRRGRSPASPKPDPKPVSEFTRVIGDVTITVCPPGYAAGLSWMGGPPAVAGVHPGTMDELTKGLATPAHVHRPKSAPKPLGYNGRGLAHPASKAADSVLR